jgi:hypothetical protein
MILYVNGPASQSSGRCKQVTACFQPVVLSKVHYIKEGNIYVFLNFICKIYP